MVAAKPAGGPLADRARLRPVHARLRVRRAEIPDVRRARGTRLFVMRSSGRLACWQRNVVMASFGPNVGGAHYSRPYAIRIRGAVRERARVHGAGGGRRAVRLGRG